MTPEELDEARAKEAWRIWNESEEDDTLTTSIIAARLAREGWTPPEPVVDPDVLAFREWAAHDYESKGWSEEALAHRLGNRDEFPRAQAYLAGARMAREGWTPPEPVVDPDVLAWREYFAKIRPEHRKRILRGEWDRISNADFFLAGARMAREQERERAKVLLEFAEDIAKFSLNYGVRANRALAKYRGEP